MDTSATWGQLIPLLLQLPRSPSGQAEWDAADPRLLQAIGQVSEQTLQCLPLQLDGLAQLLVRLETSGAASLPAPALAVLGLVFGHLVDLMDTSQVLLAEIAPRLTDNTDPRAQP